MQNNVKKRKKRTKQAYLFDALGDLLKLYVKLVPMNDCSGDDDSL